MMQNIIIPVKTRKMPSYKNQKISQLKIKYNLLVEKLMFREWGGWALPSEDSIIVGTTEFPFSTYSV